MKATFFPAVDENYASIAPVKFGIAVLVPDNYDATRPWPTKIFIHGMGNLGAGSKGELENLWLGYAYGPGGSRVNPAVPPDYTAEVDKYGIVCVFVNYKDQFQPEHLIYTYNQVRKYFKTADQWKGDGFSWGAGALVKAVQDINAARLLAVICPCAATFEQADAGDGFASSKSVCGWLFVNEGDDNGPTAMTVTQRIAAEWSKANPAIAPVYTAFDAQGHGGTNQAFTSTPPVAPNGTGFITASESTTQYYLDVLKNGPRQPRSGISTTPPVQPPPSTVKMNPVATISQVGNILKLDASASTGYTWLQWKLDKYPTGLNPYTFIKSGGYKTSDTQNVIPGDYTITLTLIGADNSTVSKSFTYTAAGSQPVPRLPVSYDSVTGLLLYSDGYQEKVTVVLNWSTHQVSIVSPSGVPINF